MGEERRGVFQSPEQLDWFLDLPLKPNGTNNNLLKLLWLQEERREVFQSLEQLDWSLDPLLKPNGTNSNLLKLLWLQEGRRGLFQFQELSPDLSLDLSEKLNGTKPNWNTLLSMVKNKKVLYASCKIL